MSTLSRISKRVIYQFSRACCTDPDCNGQRSLLQNPATTQFVIRLSYVASRHFILINDHLGEDLIRSSEKVLFFSKIPFLLNVAQIKRFNPKSNHRSLLKLIRYHLSAHECKTAAKNDSQTLDSSWLTSGYRQQQKTTTKKQLRMIPKPWIALD